MAVETYPHISIDANGTAHIGDSRYKVIHLAGEHFYYGWTAEELLRQHPDLRPEEVYAALTWFFDHYDDMVSKLKADADEVNAIRQTQSASRAALVARVE